MDPNIRHQWAPGIFAYTPILTRRGNRRGEDATTRFILLIRSIDVSIDVLTELLSLYCKAIRRVSVLFTALKAKGYLIKTKGYSYEG